MKLKIFLDLDGVCYNWSKSANKVFNINPDDQENRKILKTYHDALEMLVNKHDVYNKIENLGFEFWENLELFPWANALYESLTEIGNVTILTS
ncbi:MAG: hypothetical protein ACXW1A_05410, partial [Nitrososphaeraceae archaeon]